MAGGFSLVEVLVAGALLAGTVLLATSLFLRARMDTLAGRRHTEVSRLAGSSLEELRSLPLDRETLAIPEGRSNLSFVNRWTRDEEWLAEDDAPLALWRRSVRVRQFGIADLYDQAPSMPATLDTPLLGGVESASSHLRVVEVVLRANGPGPPGVGDASRITLVVVRAF